MVERIIVGSGNIVIPIGVQDKDDPTKIHEFNLQVDISDKALRDYKQHNDETRQALEKIETKYASVMTNEDIDDDNLGLLVDGITEMLRTRFDSDFGKGVYDEIAGAGGGNSFINMLDLYKQVSEYVDSQVQMKISKIQVKSKNKQAKYLNKRKK